VLEHVGVKAPGSENTATVLPLKISSVATLRHSPPARVRNVTFGALLPSWLPLIAILLG